MRTMRWSPGRADRMMRAEATHDMRTLGLIGGTSWVSTVEYYRIINRETQARRGGSASARMLLFSVDFSEIHALQARGDFDAVGALLANAAARLERIGADCILLCANTLHMHAARVEADMAVPLIDLVDVTAREIRSRGMRTVGLLGTRLTMERDFFPRRLHAAGIDVIVPDEAERVVVDRAIGEELVRSTFRAESRERFVTIMRGLRARGAEGVILGCTEIPLLVAPDQCPLPAFDTTQLHAMAAVDFALAAHEEQLSSSVDRS